MSWITLTSDDLTGRIMADEMTKIIAVGGNGDPFPALISEVTGEVRGYVGSRNPLGPDGMIPDELKNAALSVIVWRAVTSLPSDKLATKARETAAENATKLFGDVAKGNFLIVAPLITAPQQTSRPTVATIQSGNSGNSREDLYRL